MHNNSPLVDCKIPMAESPVLVKVRRELKGALEETAERLPPRLKKSNSGTPRTLARGEARFMMRPEIDPL